MIHRRTFLRRASGLLVPLGFPTLIKAASLSESLAFRSQAAVGCNADALTWAANATTNEGSAPSDAVKSAVCAFASAMASLKARTPYIGIIAPGATGLTARTPLFSGPLFSLWGQSVGTAGASVNGLTADVATNRWWSVGWGAGSLGINNSGFSIYMPATGGVGAFLDYGGYDGTNGVYAGLNFTGSTVVFTIGLASLQASIAYPGPGFFSFNRTASNVLKVYWGNDSNPVAQIGATVTGDNSTGAFPSGTAATQGYMLGAVNDSGVGNISRTNNTYSYLSQHEGYSLADVQQEFAAATTMRTAFGGGHV